MKTTIKAPVAPTSLHAELFAACKGNEYRLRALRAMLKAAAAPAPKGW
jgi:hypothetical protein